MLDESWTLPDAATLREAIVIAERDARANGECHVICGIIHEGALGFNVLMAAVYARMREVGAADHYAPFCSVSPTGKVELYPVLTGFTREGV